jgi:hypothetical protein
MKTWPESTCAECGEKMLNGMQKRCVNGGRLDFCSWRIPAAARRHINELESVNAELLDALYAALCSFDEHSGQHENCDACHTALKIFAAIAKAEGGAE